MIINLEYDWPYHIKQKDEIVDSCLNYFFNLECKSIKIIRKKYWELQWNNWVFESSKQSIIEVIRDELKC